MTRIQLRQAESLKRSWIGGGVFEGETIEAKKNMDGSLCFGGVLGVVWNDFVLFRFLCLFFFVFCGATF